MSPYKLCKEFLGRKDALGNILVIGRKYGFSNDSNGSLRVVIGKLIKHNKKSVTIKPIACKTAIYNDELEPVETSRNVNCKWTKLFPVVNMDALSEVEDWCDDTKNSSNSDEIESKLERL